jgi:glucan phosphoethanolaminetransferase (alkaline phosphatase superfamily)
VALSREPSNARSLRRSTCPRESIVDARDNPIAYTHPLFHPLLGLLDVRTQAYIPALDLFAGCRRVTAAR